MAEKSIGKVTHFFDRLCVVVLALTEKIQVGDTLHFSGSKTDFKQKVESLQIEHKEVNEAGPGQEVAMKVIQAARQNDTVYKVTGED